MENATLILADDGTVIEPPLHDGRLVGLSIVDKHAAVVTTATLRGDVYKFDFNEVISLVADNVRDGNIILYISIALCEYIGASDILSCLGVSSYEEHCTYVDSIITHIMDGDLLFVEINTSYIRSFMCIF